MTDSIDVLKNLSAKKPVPRKTNSDKASPSSDNRQENFAHEPEDLTLPPAGANHKQLEDVLLTLNRYPGYHGPELEGRDKLQDGIIGMSVLKHYKVRSITKKKRSFLITN